MFNRRQFILRSTTAGLGLHFALVRNAKASAPLVAEVAQGKLQGEARDGFQIFRGVPFAEPPIGPLRFRAPVPSTVWKGVRDATRFAAAAMQPNEPALAQSEDCLHLNVWAPQGGGPYPVFVWIHGGGFTGGHSFDPLFDGERFAKEGIVCITVAYRLGVLGFLDVAPLLGPSYAGSANSALRDLIAALTWVKANVHVFGGDAQRVTIGGESAGAKLADILMGIPSAAPLFQQVISESGGAERIWPRPRAEEVARGFGALWTGSTALAPEHLLSAPAQEMMAVQQQFTRDWPVHFPLRAEFDGTLIPRSPLQTIRSGSTRGKRLLLGTNRDESALFLGPHPAKAPGAADLGNVSLAQFQLIVERYRQLYPAMSDEMRRIRSVTAEEYWVPSLRVADAHLAGGGEAFVYRLDFPGEGRFAGLAFHSYDLRFVWNSFGKEVPSPAAQALATGMHGAWSAFIKGEVPQAAGLPSWPSYKPGTRLTMILDATSHLERAPSVEELSLWDGLLMN